MKWSRPLDDGQILGVMSDEGRGLYRGCYWAEETRHGVLDIDIDSKFHNSQALAELSRKFAAVGLPLTPYQSSDSGGWHLYFFLNDWAPSADVESTIKAYLKAHRYEIKSGTLEVFPSGNALRLPLQRGFGWLTPDGKLNKRREDLTRDEALASFLTDIENNAGNWELAKLLIESQNLSAGIAGDAGAQGEEDPQSYEGFEGLFRSGLDWEKYQRGREYWINGLSDRSQRHDGILCVGHYLWYGDKSAGVQALPHLKNAEARAEKIRAWLEGKHNGRSRAVNRGEWTQINGDIERAANWTGQEALIRDYEPYPLTDRLLKRLKWLNSKTGKLWTVEELEKANLTRSLDARQRIAESVQDCLTQGIQVTRNRLAEMAGCSPNTVSKHRDLWFRLEAGSGVYSGGAGGFSGQLVLLSASLGYSGTGSEGQEKNLPVLSCGSLELAGHGPSEVAPLFPCLATSQPESPQCQAQALRVATPSLTLGPKLSGIQALGHVTAGGILFSLPACYADATNGGIRERRQDSAIKRSLSSFGTGKKSLNTVLDATNIIILTTVKSGSRSELLDKISQRHKNTVLAPSLKAIPGGALPADRSSGALVIDLAVHSCYYCNSGIFAPSLTGNGGLLKGCAARKQSIGGILPNIRRTLGRAPPKCTQHILSQSYWFCCLFCLSGVTGWQGL